MASLLFRDNSPAKRTCPITLNLLYTHFCTYITCFFLTLRSHLRCWQRSLNIFYSHQKGMVLHQQNHSQSKTPLKKLLLQHCPLFFWYKLPVIASLARALQQHTRRAPGSRENALLQRCGNRRQETTIRLRFCPEANPDRRPLHCSRADTSVLLGRRSHFSSCSNLKFQSSPRKAHQLTARTPQPRLPPLPETAGTMPARCPVPSRREGNVLPPQSEPLRPAGSRGQRTQPLSGQGFWYPAPRTPTSPQLPTAKPAGREPASPARGTPPTLGFHRPTPPIQAHADQQTPVPPAASSDRGQRGAGPAAASPPAAGAREPQRGRGKEEPPVWQSPAGFPHRRAQQGGTDRGHPSHPLHRPPALRRSPRAGHGHADKKTGKGGGSGKE